MGFIPEFDSSDWEVIRAMVRDFKQKRYNQVGPSLSPGMRFTPDTFMALTPTGGIPSRDGFVPGKATCQVYRIVDINGVGTLQSVTDLTRVVYNSSIQAIDGGQFIKIQSDKWGRWLPDGCNICFYDDTGTGTGIVGEDEPVPTVTYNCGICASRTVWPETLYLIPNYTSGCLAALNGMTIPLVFHPPSNLWLADLTSEGACGANTVTFQLNCNASFWRLTTRCDAGGGGSGAVNSAAPTSCDPLLVENISLFTPSSDCGLSNGDADITETPP